MGTQGKGCINPLCIDVLGFTDVRSSKEARFKPTKQSTNQPTNHSDYHHYYHYRDHYHSDHHHSSVTEPQNIDREMIECRHDECSIYLTSSTLIIYSNSISCGMTRVSHVFEYLILILHEILIRIPKSDLKIHQIEFAVICFW